MKDREDIMDDLEELQHKTDAMGFVGSNEHDLWLREAIADYVVKLFAIPIVSGSLLSDKEIEEHIWEGISVPLSQLDIDNQTDEYIDYLNAIHWAKFGRDARNDR